MLSPRSPEARQKRLGLQVVLVSSDKDLRQLITDNVRMFNCRKREFFDADDLQKVWNIRPDQVIDFQSLVGDSVDNVPGVPLIGPKKATALLEQFGDLDAVLANADKAPGKKLRENLVTFAEQARVSKKLVTLRTDLPLEIEIEKAKTEGYNTEQLQQLFLDFGFRKFRDDLRELESPTSASAQQKKQPPKKKLGRGLFDNLPEEQATDSGTITKVSTSSRDWHIVDQKKSLQELMEKLLAAKEVCVDLETTSLDAMQADIVGWAISYEPGDAYYIPVDGPAGQTCLDSKRSSKRCDLFWKTRTSRSVIRTSNTIFLS